MGGKEGAGGVPPAPPKTGAHGGGGLYRQGKDRARIAARPIGTYVTGATAPWAARIGITLQALKAAALYQLGPPGRHRCHASEISWWSWQLYRGARRPGAPSVEYRADTKRGNLVRNLRGTSSAAASKFCGVIDAGRPSAAARERSPPGNRARWTHARLMPGSTQSTAAVLPRVQGPQALVVFPPLLPSKAGRPPRRRSPEAGPPLAGRPQVAPTDGAPGSSRPTDWWFRGKRADTIRPYGLGSWRTALVRPAPRGRARFRTKKRAARDTGGACVYRSSRKYAKPRLAGGCLSRLLRREVKISTTTVTT